MTQAALPTVNSLVELTLPNGREYPTRVEDAAGPALALAAPPSQLEPPEPGSELALRWSAGVRGRYVVPVRLVEIARGDVSLWRVAAMAEPAIEQRRRFARAEAHDTVQVRAPGASASLAGRLIDIGEGGLRCRLAPSALAADQPASVSVRLDDRILAIEGTVLRILPGPSAEEVDVVIVMELGEADAGLVRRYVMRQQMLARKLAAYGTD